MTLYDRLVLGVLRDMFELARHHPEELFLYRQMLEDIITFGEE